tara:strand:- start:8725 stop:9195 length:471 start_codon:yes stop_codon:yes gene_type:complete
MEETFNPNERILTAPLALEHIKSNGGCTFGILHNEIDYYPFNPDTFMFINKDFSTHRQAFAVAIHLGDDLRIANYLLCDDHLLHLIIENFCQWVQYQSPSAYFGAWVDGDDLVLDATEVLHYIDDAFEVAVRFDQYAIYDLINDEVIRVQPDGGDE